MAVQTIKSITRGPWGEHPHTRSTWYEPLEDQVEIDTAVAYVLSRPGIFLNTVGDIHVLPRVLDAANRLGSAPQDAAGKVPELELTPLFV